jgi:hypothetical protein
VHAVLDALAPLDIDNLDVAIRISRTSGHRARCSRERGACAPLLD